jgi:hypothetical protein
MSTAAADKDNFNEDDLVDYEVAEEEAGAAEKPAEGADAKKGSYVGIHSSGFKDFLLKPELLRAISDCGFEHPSEGKQRGARARRTRATQSVLRQLSLILYP